MARRPTVSFGHSHCEELKKYFSATYTPSCVCVYAHASVPCVRRLTSHSTLSRSRTGVRVHGQREKGHRRWSGEERRHCHGTGSDGDDNTRTTRVARPGTRGSARQATEILADGLNKAGTRRETRKQIKTSRGDPTQPNTRTRTTSRQTTNPLHHAPPAPACPTP